MDFELDDYTEAYIGIHVIFSHFIFGQFIGSVTSLTSS